jgi:hypothetical protein
MIKIRHVVVVIFLHRPTSYMKPTSVRTENAPRLNPKRYASPGS